MINYYVSQRFDFKPFILPTGWLVFQSDQSGNTVSKNESNLNLVVFKPCVRCLD